MHPLVILAIVGFVPWMVIGTAQYAQEANEVTCRAKLELTGDECD